MQLDFFALFSSKKSTLDMIITSVVEISADLGPLTPYGNVDLV